MTREEFMELVYLTLNDRPTNCDANAIIDAHDGIVGKLESILNAYSVVGQTLNSIAPLPWSVKEDDISGYIVDAEGNWIFGGEIDAGMVSAKDPVVAALLGTVNMLHSFNQIAEVLMDG